MGSNSILLPINGSEETTFASDFAWKLAQRTRSRVTAQHVIDTSGALEFFGHDKPGFVGSGVTIVAYQSLCESLRMMAAKIAQAYSAHAAGFGFTSDVLIDEGNPPDEILRRAADHQLIVIGHRRRAGDCVPECQITRWSLAEMLAHRSEVPLLIVQEPVQRLSEFVVFISMEHVNMNWLNACVKSAQNIGAQCYITILASGFHEEQPLDFARDLRQADPELESVRIKVISGSKENPARICTQQIFENQPADSRLIVIPTIDAGEHRITPWGACPTAVLREFAFESMLIWPEEHATPLFKAAKKSPNHTAV